MKFNYIKKKFAERIKNLTSKYVYHYKFKAFTFIEILFTLFITILSLSLIPNIIHLTSYYLQLAQDNDDIDYEFFSRDILKDITVSKHHLNIESNSTIMIKNKDEDIRYIYKNQKIYKNINQRGNITLLNNVVSFKIIKTNNNFIKIVIKQGDSNNNKDRTLYI